MIYLRLGSSYYASGGTVYSLESLSPHPYYDSTTHDYDIAVLKLSASISVSGSVGTISLPPSGAALSIVSNAVFTSWGGLASSIGCLSSTQLGEIDITTVSSTSCTSSYPSLYLSERQFCGRYTARSDGVCIVSRIIITESCRVYRYLINRSLILVCLFVFVFSSILLSITGTLYVLLKTLLVHVKFLCMPTFQHTLMCVVATGLVTVICILLENKIYIKSVI